MNTKDGGPAFPQIETTVHMAGNHDDGYTPLSDVHSVGGMSLRDYFAAKALAGIASEKLLLPCLSDDECALRITNAAALSYRLADAMLAAREQTP